MNSAWGMSAWAGQYCSKAKKGRRAWLWWCSPSCRSCVLSLALPKHSVPWGTGRDRRLWNLRAGRRSQEQQAVIQGAPGTCFKLREAAEQGDLCPAGSRARPGSAMATQAVSQGSWPVLHHLWTNQGQMWKTFLAIGLSPKETKPKWPCWISRVYRVFSPLLFFHFHSLLYFWILAKTVRLVILLFLYSFQPWIPKFWKKRYSPKCPNPILQTKATQKTSVSSYLSKLSLQNFQTLVTCPLTSALKYKHEEDCKEILVVAYIT